MNISISDEHAAARQLALLNFAADDWRDEFPDALEKSFVAAPISDAAMERSLNAVSWLCEALRTGWLRAGDNDDIDAALIETTAANDTTTTDDPAGHKYRACFLRLIESFELDRRDAWVSRKVALETFGPREADWWEERYDAEGRLISERRNPVTGHVDPTYVPSKLVEEMSNASAWLKEMFPTSREEWLANLVRALNPRSMRDQVIDWMDANSWAALDIPPEPRLLGDLLTSTARVFIVGSTGLGKTQLAHGMAAGIASGAGFLHWKAERPARVLLIDGEMSRSLIKDRIGSALRRSLAAVPPGSLVVYGLDRSEEFAVRFPDLGLFEPLNTTKGHDFVKRLITLVRPEAVILDNVMSLISGDQKDEVPWSETLPLVAWITSQGIGQVWLDHTGHDRSRQYGSATKAWRFDAVGIMTAVDDKDDGAVAFQLSFDDPGKARRRTPENWRDFAPHLITLAGDRWTSEPAGQKAADGGVRFVKPSIEKWYDALMTALVTSATPGKATTAEWFAAGIQAGLVDAITEDDTRTEKARKRARLGNAKADLVTARWIGVNGDDIVDLIEGRKPSRASSQN